MTIKAFSLQGIVLINADLQDALISWAGKINLILTSPPYNISSKSPTKYTHRKNGGFDAKSFGAVRSYPDNLPEEQYRQQQLKFLSEWVPQHLAPNGTLIYNHKLRYRDLVLIDPVEHFPPKEKLFRFDTITWDRGSTHNHGKIRTYQQTELLYAFCQPGAKPYFRNQSAPWEGNCKNGRPRKGMGNIWHVPPETKREVKYDCVMPLALAEHVIRCFSKKGDLVADPHFGSGTTAVACLRLGRPFVGCDISEKAFNEARQRLLDEAAKLPLAVAA